MLSILCFLFMLVFLGIQIYARLFSMALLAAVSKTICSILFLMIVFFSQRECPKTKSTTYFKLVFIGLSFCAIGDFLLNFSSGKPNIFLTGAGVFAIAHIFFFIAFFQFEKFTIPDFIWSVLFSISLIWLISQEQWFKLGKMTPMLICYGIIISVMVSKSFSLWKYRNLNGTFVYTTIAATILFMISDIILLFACFSILGADNGLKALNNFVYYISVALLGLSFKKELLPEALHSNLIT